MFDNRATAVSINVMIACDVHAVAHFRVENV